MKLFIAIVILAIVFMASCTQQSNLEYSKPLNNTEPVLTKDNVVFFMIWNSNKAKCEACVRNTTYCSANAFVHIQLKNTDEWFEKNGQIECKLYINETYKESFVLNSSAEYDKLIGEKLDLRENYETKMCCEEICQSDELHAESNCEYLT